MSRAPTTLATTGADNRSVLVHTSPLGRWAGRPRWARWPGERTIVGALVVYAVLSRAFMAVAIPPWQAPDETKHFEYARLLVDKRYQLVAERRLLTVDDASPELETQIIASMARHHFWAYLGQPAPDELPANFVAAFGPSPTLLHRPSLYYLLEAVTVLPLQGRTLEEQLLAMRLVSTVLGGLTILPAYGLLRLIAPRDPFVAVAGTALVAALPMNVFIGGMVNNDNLLLLLGMLTCFGMTSGVTRGLSGRTWALILGGALLGVLTKRGAGILLPGVLACAGVGLVRLEQRRRRWIALSLAGGIVALALGLTSGLLAQVLPLERAQTALIAYALNGMYQWDDLLKVPLDAPQTRQIVETELNAYFLSFWGIFGWFSVALSGDTYEVLRTVTRVCGLGFLAWCSGLLPPQIPSTARRLTLVGLLLILLTSGVAAGVVERLPYYSPGEVPQGRYLFVVLGPIAALYALGLRAWLPQRFVGTAAPIVGVLCALVVLDAYAYFSTVQPYFGRPFP